MKKLSFLLLALCLAFTSCSKDESSREEEQARLDKMYDELIEYSQVNSKTCTNPEEWNILKYGESACSGFYIYNKSVDAAVFRKKVDSYREARSKFDAKWGVYYDAYPCETVVMNTRISCVEGKATIVYDNTKGQ